VGLKNNRTKSKLNFSLKKIKFNELRRITFEVPSMILPGVRGPIKDEIETLIKRFVKIKKIEEFRSYLRTSSSVIIPEDQTYKRRKN
jgi:hypothetical protein